MNDSIEILINEALEGEKYPLAKLISLLEKQDSVSNRKIIFNTLEKNNIQKGITIGITGSPGAGKSSLIGEICKEFLISYPHNSRLAIVAIDPSSTITGGSILGDRTRVTIPVRENRIFFRSQASQLELGGMNPYTYHVIRLLRYFFQYIIIETVGIGQNEIEVASIADFSFLVLQPLGGDHIQFMKSGIMEVPNAFIINKCDEEELANLSYHTLQTSLEFLKDTLEQNSTTPPIFKTSVTKNIGIKELMKYISTIAKKNDEEKELIHQIIKWVKTEYGNYGLRKLTPLLQKKLNYSFEQLEEEFNRIVRI
ncbi:MAG: P-loop NTPase fold protein [Leptospiraceae bacterium]|nr:P-loop NTPase fold protein [Leptospiraceae bacterium]